MNKIIDYYLRLWLPAFCTAWCEERQEDDDEFEWLQAGAEQAVEKFLQLALQRQETK